MASLLGVSHLINQISTSSLLHVRVVHNTHIATQELRAKESEKDNVCVHSTEEDANDLSVLVAVNLALGREGELLSNGGLDSRTGARGQVTELVRGTDDESSERAGRQLHQVDGDDSPCALDTELFEEGGGDDGGGAGIGVWVEKSTADDTDEDDAETTAEDGTAVSDGGASGHGAQVGDDLGNGDLVGGEVVLVAQHGGVEILGAVRHEVEAGHEKNHVRQQKPVALEGDLALLEEGAADVA